MRRSGRLPVQAIEYYPAYQKDSASASRLTLAPMCSGGRGRQKNAGSGKCSVAPILFSILLVICTLCHGTPVYGSTLQLEMHDHMLSLKAADADISGILQRLSQVAGIAVRFPKALQKKITLSLSDVGLETALKRILKGINYATVYSVPDNGDMARVSAVYIFGKQKAVIRTRQAILREQRIQNRIRSYEKHIRSVQQRMSRVPQDSPAAQRYQRQIRNYRRIIERLQRQR